MQECCLCIFRFSVTLRKYFEAVLRSSVSPSATPWPAFLRSPRGCELATPLPPASSFPNPPPYSTLQHEFHLTPFSLTPHSYSYSSSSSASSSTSSFLILFLILPFLPLACSYLGGTASRGIIPFSCASTILLSIYFPPVPSSPPPPPSLATNQPSLANGASAGFPLVSSFLPARPTPSQRFLAPETSRASYPIAILTFARRNAHFFPYRSHRRRSSFSTNAFNPLFSTLGEARASLFYFLCNNSQENQREFF